MLVLIDSLLCLCCYTLTPGRCKLTINQIYIKDKVPSRMLSYQTLEDVSPLFRLL